ncbi:MAG: IscS subfamily cysteine desulfurase [Proteobacteria bacterium]|nr:IscS subfamily cysteine desulfurase [Pseudomonadota bacterium]
MGNSGATDGAGPGLRKRDVPVYLDYQATTPTDPRVVQAMLPYFSEKFGNPHSREHFFGWEAEDAVEKARGEIAGLIGATAREVIFTSGATESNNMALKGVARFYKDRKDHIVTCVTEHKCVLETARHLEHEGFRVTCLPVGATGLIDLDTLRDAITENTVMVSVMAVNNEIGVIQPIGEIGAICRERGAFFHTDAAQAVGKIPLDVDAMHIDLMSISGHKIYGPMGIGALYVRRRPRVRLVALMDGGGQERGLRSGTLPTPLCVGLGEACAIAGREMGDEAERVAALRDRFYKGITGRLPGVHLNGDAERRIPGNLNLSFADVDSEGLMAGIKDLAVSSGSACTSASVEPSYVLRAIGLDDGLARGAIRVGFGRFTTEDDVDFAVDRIAGEVERLRRTGPLRETA